MDLPDKASVWRPPAATVTIFTPGLNDTKQGSADSISSLDVELSGACLADDSLLRLVLSSPPRISWLDGAPLDLESWDLGITATDSPFIKIYLEKKWVVLYVVN